MQCSSKSTTAATACFESQVTDLDTSNADMESRLTDALDHVDTLIAEKKPSPTRLVHSRPVTPQVALARGSPCTD